MKRTYEVEIAKTFFVLDHIEASSQEEAEELIRDKLGNGAYDFVKDSDDEEVEMTILL